MKTPNNIKQFKKGTETQDIMEDIKERIYRELKLLDLEDNMNLLTNDIRITLDIDIYPIVKKLKQKQ